MKHIVYLAVLMFAVLVSSAVSAGGSALTSEVVRTFGVDRTSVQNSISLLQLKIDRAVVASTSRDSYPSLSEAQYRDYLALHYERVLDQARLVKERLLDENAGHVRPTYLPRVDALLLHDEAVSGLATRAVTYDFWQRIILEMHCKYSGIGAAEK